MAHRLDIKRIIQSNFVRDLPMIVLGCAIAAFATDMFMIPNGLAAGGVTGVATIIQELGARNGLTLPVGMQTIVINAVLLLAVARAGGLLYVIQTVTGFVLLGVFTDLFAPFVTPLGGDELMLSALWGALACGLGYGLVLRCGSNTGGSDTIGQIISRKTSLPVGTTTMVIDVTVCALSIPVFSLLNALYAALAMVLMGIVVDAVVDGGNKRRMAFIISDKFPDIAADILYGLGRGCTKLSATGMWSGNDKPVLMVILERRELSPLKSIVAERDRDAIVIISDVTEAFGEGFKELGA